MGPQGLGNPKYDSLYFLLESKQKSTKNFWQPEKKTKKNIILQEKNITPKNKFDCRQKTKFNNSHWKKPKKALYSRQKDINKK